MGVVVSSFDYVAAIVVCCGVEFSMSPCDWLLVCGGESVMLLDGE